MNLVEHLRESSTELSLLFLTRLSIGNWKLFQNINWGERTILHVLAVLRLVLCTSFKYNNSSSRCTKEKYIFNCNENIYIQRPFN